jgi:hypothetical protein
MHVRVMSDGTYIDTFALSHYVAIRYSSKSFVVWAA